MRRHVDPAKTAFAVLLIGASAALADGDGLAWDRVVGVDVASLSDAQKARVEALAASTPNYGTCRGTVAECLEQDAVARRLAGYLARKVKDGKADAEITEGVANRRRSARPARPVEIDLSEAPCMGPADARVTVVEFAEYECPFCKQASVFVERLIRARSDKVRFCVKFFPVRSHERAVPACVAAAAAARQGRFWQMHAALFGSAPDLSDAALERAATTAGLDLTRFRADLAGEELLEWVEADKLEGQEAGVDRTPSFFVNGKRYYGELTEVELADRIDEEAEM